MTSSMISHSMIFDIASHLFGTQSIPNWIKSPASANMGQYARINNDVPGFKKLIRDGSCVSCNVEKARTDVAFYLDLRDRFRLKPAVEKFRTRHFTGKAVIGMHIRAGNGESGDFVQRGRAIYNLTMWMDSLTDQLVAIVKSQKWDNNAVIFIATDTPSLVDRIRMLLVEKKTPNSRTAVPVVHFDQVRPSEGSGVYFGVQGKVHSEGVECLHGWENTLTDMMLLSYADMVVAARPSSFTQSLPMSIVLARNTSARLAQNPYCEISPNATEMQCFRDFYDWCCRGRTEFSLKGIQRYDYLRMPQSDIGDDVDVENAITRKRFKISQRPESGCVPTPTNTKQICLPFNWSEFVLKRQGPRPNGDR